MLEALVLAERKDNELKKKKKNKRMSGATI